jgi:hypothetical protein
MTGMSEEFEIEVVEGELVEPEGGEVGPLAPAPAGAVRPGAQVPLPARQAAVAAAGGFLAGATLMALAKRLLARRLSERMLPERSLEPWPAGTTRTYLVHVRLLSRSDG